MSNEDPRETQAQAAKYGTIADPVTRLAVRGTPPRGRPLRRDFVSYLLNRVGLKPSERTSGRFDFRRGYPRWTPPTQSSGYYVLAINCWEVEVTWRGDDVTPVEVAHKLKEIQFVLGRAGLVVTREVARIKVSRPEEVKE